MNGSLVVGSFTPKIEAAVMALGELLETLSDSPHPQEFGMDGCPICKARDAIGEAVVSVQDVQDPPTDLDARCLIPRW